MVQKLFLKKLHLLPMYLNADAGPDQLDMKNQKEAVDKYFTLEAYLPAGSTANGKL